MSKNKILIIYIVLAVATLIAFWQVNYCDFINYDDVPYISQNSHIQNGITMESIRWAFTTGYQANWHPLTWISHMLDIQLFGLNPHWHHIMNLLFHIANTLLLFFVLNRMTKRIWQCAFVAALFALHPLHVESVAWLAERKDVLSTFFWIFTMGAYCYYVERPGLRRYLPVLIFFVLGLMAKPMLVTLPFVLLLLDYWPLRRFGQIISDQEIQTKSNNSIFSEIRKGKSKGKNTITVKEEIKAERSTDSNYRWALLRPLLWEKIPLFVLAVLSSVVTFVAQQRWGAMVSIEKLPLSARISNTFISYIIYIEKMIWPNNLSIFYPYSRHWQLWQVMVAAFILIAITFLVIRAAKRLQYLAVGWLWYVGTLVPVIGLVQVGEQSRADRYTYIPLIGLFIIAAWGIPELMKKWRYRDEMLVASSSITLSCFFIITWTQVSYWQNSLMLYNHALKVTDNNYLAYNNRGYTYEAFGNYKQAIEDYDRAIEIDPEYAIGYYNRGHCNQNHGNIKQAIKDYDRAIEINPKNVIAYTNRGLVIENLGNFKQAIENFDKSIEINPKYAEAYLNRGNAYSAIGNQKQAMEDYDKAIEINPNLAEVYYNRGVVYAALGNYNQAIKDYDRAIEIKPNFAGAYLNRGNAYLDIGNQKQAIEDCDKAIEINPNLADAYLNRGVAYAAIGNLKKAIEDYDRAIETNPKLAKAYVNRGNAYTDKGNYKLAFENFDRAIKIKPNLAEAYYNRGYSWFKLGDYKQAIGDYDRAIKINPKLTLAYLQRAFLYNKLGNQKQVIEDLKAAAVLGDTGAQNFLRSHGLNI